MKKYAISFMKCEEDGHFGKAIKEENYVEAKTEKDACIEYAKSKFPNEKIKSIYETEAGFNYELETGLISVEEIIHK